MRNVSSFFFLLLSLETVRFRVLKNPKLLPLFSFPSSFFYTHNTFYSELLLLLLLKSEREEQLSNKKNE